MFERILIANRGEIACRVIDTARRMGIATIAVYSDADAEARHVLMADEAVHIGASAPAQSYLRGDALIEIALAMGAQAIHPGYGFLSENPDFVAEVEAAGLVFIGPSAQAIRAMGLKDAAKKLMHDAGVPVVPGYHGDNQDPEHLAGAADAIGYPVLIKAVAGGGGKGMRKVTRPEDFAEAVESARSEARGAFGNDALLIEKFVETPRHIEVQVFGDGTRAVYLFERDCSLQRRHQKVIEEAPAPGMTRQMRAEMGAAAVRAAEAIGYAGAGTVEFIVDASDGLRPDRFWFMEMNTRLQVEHPVTEAVTGLDLVEWQLRIAAGEPLPARQEDLRLEGHAFEARLYAEDVPAGFLPATGRLTHLAFPPDVRADSGVRAGDEISPFYDPMIAKIVVHGPTRAVALNRLHAALQGTEVAGSVTNLTFLRRLSRHADFVAGRVDTGLIERSLDELAAPITPCTRTRALAALAALGLGDGDGGDDPLEGFTLWQPLRRSVRLQGVDDLFDARILVQGPGRYHVVMGADGQEGAVAAEHLVMRAAGRWRVDEAPLPARVRAVRDDATVTVFFGDAYGFEVVDPLERAAEAAAGDNVIAAPMPGMVKSVAVAPGQTVAAGDRLAVLEAMKMEHSLTAWRDGVVDEVLAAAGMQVAAGDALIALRPQEDPE